MNGEVLAVVYDSGERYLFAVNELFYLVGR